MLAELAVANAAFAVIKEAVQNSGDIMQAGQALFSFFDSEATLQKRLTDKSGDTVNTDLEEFMALEQIRANKAELERMMTYNGRAGLLEDWRAFQVKAARQREALKREAAIAQAKKKKQIAETIWLTVLAVVLACTLYFSVLMIDVVRTKQ